MEVIPIAIAPQENNKLDSSSSTNTQIIESNDVPPLSEKVYEKEVGWNINQSQTGQGIEGDFQEEKFELTDDEIQSCLKELRQVEKADNYWELYNQCPRLLTQAWNQLNLGEQLRIQLLCDEGIDPFEKWKEGDRVMLWHPFGQNWGLATVKQVVTGEAGSVYALRDDGLGLHLGRDRLGLIASV